MKVYLKNSSLLVQFDNMENHMDESYAMEYEGLAPDIWLPSSVSRKYAERLIKQK